MKLRCILNQYYQSNLQMFFQRKLYYYTLIYSNSTVVLYLYRVSLLNPNYLLYQAKNNILNMDAYCKVDHSKPNLIFGIFFTHSLVSIFSMFILQLLFIYTGKLIEIGFVILFKSILFDPPY